MNTATRMVLIVRHAKAQGSRHDRHLFPKEGAPLSEEGEKDAKKLKQQLIDLGIEIESEPVAISELVRTQQTANCAGLMNLREYAVLNEVDSGLAKEELDTMITQKQIPPKAREAARALLKNPPTEKIWVTHGMLIAAVAEELGIPADEQYIPEMASITRLKIPYNRQ